MERGVVVSARAWTKTAKPTVENRYVILVERSAIHDQPVITGIIQVLKLK